MDYTRRRLLSLVGATGALAVAGCSSDDNGAEDGDGGGGGSESNSGVDIELTDATTESVDGESTGVIEVTNNGEEGGSVNIASRLQIGTDGVYGTHVNEESVTVPAGESTTTELLLVNRGALSEVAATELTDGYAVLSFLLDGEQEFEEELGDRPSQHVSFRVVYDGQWQGALGAGGNMRTIQGNGGAHMPVDNDAFIISGNAQKQDDSTSRLVSQIIVDGAVVAEQSTTASYGVAQISAEASGDPLDNPTVPYEPELVSVRGASSTADPSDTDQGNVPGPEEAKSTVEEYYAALYRADIETLNDLRHPDSPGAEFSAEEFEGIEEFDYQLNSTEVVSIDESEGVATVRADVVIARPDGETESFEPMFELRVSDGEWKIWVPEQQ